MTERDTTRRCTMCNGRGGRDSLRWSDAIGSTVPVWLECSVCDGTGHPPRIEEATGDAYCDDPCHLAPIHGFNWIERAINFACWWMIVHVVPVRWMMAWPFRWMLPLCGNHAYACTCPDKNRAKRLALRAAGGGA